MPSGTVVVTGASSGIGEATALELRSLGFSVVAGVRSREDGERLGAQGLTPLRLEITDAASIAAAAAEVESLVGADGLAGLVNNAGIAVAAPIEFVPLDELRRALEVNLVGQVAVTQAFLPLLRIAEGRVINISSIAGRVALPLMGPYAASKFALEGVSDSLRRELHGQGIEVVAIEPGGIKTPIWEKGVADAERMTDALPPEAQLHYGRLVGRCASRRAESPRSAGCRPARWPPSWPPRSRPPGPARATWWAATRGSGRRWRSGCRIEWSTGWWFGRCGRSSAVRAPGVQPVAHEPDRDERGQRGGCQERR